ncbi:hypothetical protein AB5I41_14070 [Sphingomonas sp. MMS24-JH45]
MAMRFRAPCPALAELVIDYAFYDFGPAGSQRRVNEYMPVPQHLDDLRCRSVAPLRYAIIDPPGPTMSWSSSTSHAFRAESHGGRLVGIGLTALGWARLFGKNADAAANLDPAPRRAVGRGAGDQPLRRRRCHGRRRRCRGGGAGPPPRRRCCPRTAMLPPFAISPRSCRIRTSTNAPPPPRTSASAKILVVADRQALFGFGPKFLLRRHRFMRALADLRGGGGGGFTTYYDQSHFIRDANLFLGRTARRFGLSLTPMMEGMLAGRTARFGAPAQGLIAAGRDNVNPG